MILQINRNSFVSNWSLKTILRKKSAKRKKKKTKWPARTWTWSSQPSKATHARVRPRPSEHNAQRPEFFLFFFLLTGGTPVIFQLGTSSSQYEFLSSSYQPGKSRPIRHVFLPPRPRNFVYKYPHISRIRTPQITISTPPGCSEIPRRSRAPPPPS
jgi:hypothetical protein